MLALANDTNHRQSHKHKENCRWSNALSISQKYVTYEEQTTQ